MISRQEQIERAEAELCKPAIDRIELDEQVQAIDARREVLEGGPGFLL